MGYKWTQSIATHDRVFKSKVITMVIQELPMALKLAPTQTLVIDYAGTPEEDRMVDGALQIRPPPDLAPLGEADIKFARYAEICRDLLVDSVDWDSIPIALIHQELAFSDLPGGTMRSEDLAGSPPRICIRRITTRWTRPGRPPRKNQDGQGSIQASRPSVLHLRVRQHPAPAPVFLRLLYHALRDILLQCTGPLPSKHYMCMLLGLIGLAGTNYTSNMPQVSGLTLFNLLPVPDLIFFQVEGGSSLLSAPTQQRQQAPQPAQLSSLS